MITSNKAKCLKCGDIIESKHRHDFVWCSCGAIAVDGGLDYIRRVGALESVEELSENDGILIKSKKKRLNGGLERRTEISQDRRKIMPLLVTYKTERIFIIPNSGEAFDDKRKNGERRKEQ